MKGWHSEAGRHADSSLRRFTTLRSRETSGQPKILATHGLTELQLHLATVFMPDGHTELSADEWLMVSDVEQVDPSHYLSIT